LQDWQDLLRYPLADDRWILKMLIGSLIILLPILNLTLLGYAIACMDMGMRGSRKLPQWEAWRDYIGDALSAGVILIVYLLIPMILTMVLCHIPLIGVFLGAAAIILAGGLIPMALAAYAVRRDISEAFALGDIIKQIANNLDTYLLAYFSLILLFCWELALIIAIPYLAWLWAFIMFYEAVIFSYLIGCLARAA